MLPAAASADDDKPVRFEQLPGAAREFIKKYFPEAKITLATVDREFMDTTYDVIFTDGTKIVFDSGGGWKEIDCRTSYVPEGIMPPGMVRFIHEHYPKTRVRNIERDRRGYDVNLDNRRELRFDSRGNFRGYDD